MAYKKGRRNEVLLFPESMEDYVRADDPVRMYDAFVEELDFEKIDLKLNEKKVGNSEYDPKAMLKLLLYGYSYGIRSSRKLERAAHHNITFIWLTGGLKPDHKTIARFRKRNKKVLKQVFVHCAKLCIKLNLIEGNILFVDGSKFKGNASIDASWTKDRCQKRDAYLNQAINKLLKDCERADKQEQSQASFVHMKEELSDLKEMRKKIRTVMTELEEEKRNELNISDRDAIKIKSRQGNGAGYNVQVVTDDKHGIIVSADVVNTCCDNRQLSKQINQANEILERKCSVACADAGYVNSKQAKELDDIGISIVMPSQKQVIEERKPGKISKFDKIYFDYDADTDTYICPKGKRLTYRYTDGHNRNKINRVYKIIKPSICKACAHFGECTTAREGRRVGRLKYQDMKDKLDATYLSAKGQDIYKRRMQTVELVFGHLKHNLKAHRFLLKGLENVKAEFSILATCFNLRRIQSIIGVDNFVCLMNTA